jgi:hypothetical protein
MDALAASHDAAVQMIDTLVVRVRQHGACMKIHAVVDTNGRLALTPAEAHDNRLSSVLLSALLPQTNVTRRSRIRRSVSQAPCLFRVNASEILAPLPIQEIVAQHGCCRVHLRCDGSVHATFDSCEWSRDWPSVKAA